MTLEQFPHPVEYLPASPADAEGILAVQLDGWIGAYSNPALGITPDLIAARFANRDERLASWRKRIAQAAAGDSDTRIWVAKDSGEVIGYCAPFKTLENGGRLGAIYVRPAYHGTGVASHLIELALEWFGTRPMDIKVVAYNPRALAFYKKFGFIETGSDSMAIGDKVLPLINMRRGVVAECLRVLR